MMRLRLILPLLLCLAAAPAVAQTPPLRIHHQPEHLGLMGQVSPAQFNGLRLDLRSSAPQPFDVLLRWVLPDHHGDTLLAQRRLTVNPNQPNPAWIYAPIPHSQTAGPWQIRAYTVENDQPAQLAATYTLAPDAVTDPRQTVVGLLGAAELGLTAYTHPYTRHEALDIRRGMRLSNLPDRWFGLRPAHALIWTRDGGDPDEPAITPAMRDALRHWVQRGGHLVILLPTVGETWSRSHLANLLPVQPDQLERVDRRPPTWLGVPRQEQPETIEYTVFDVPEAQADRVLLRDREDQPVVMAQRVGFGRVTLVGIDLASPEIVRLGLPNGRFRLWNDIFDWPGPVYEADVAQRRIRDGDLGRPENRQTVQLDAWITPRITMYGATGPVLLVATLVFGVYFLLAGPLGLAVLRKPAWARYAWPGFLALGLVFSAVTWGGAWIIRPQHPHAAHVSVIDFDMDAGQTRTQSWLSLFLPDFGRTRVSLDDGEHAGANLLASLGATESDNPGFLDPQPYSFDAASPHQLDLPTRATARLLQLDHLGEPEPQWQPPTGRVELREGWPEGELQHQWEAAVRDVLIVYCPGQGQAPWVWRQGGWSPGEPLTIRRPDTASRLSERPAGRNYDAARRWNEEGFLGELIGQRTGQRFDQTDLRRLADNQIIQAIEMLSFYHHLPPPDFRSTLADDRQPASQYQRPIARALDLSHLTAQRRLIILGYLPEVSLPAPLRLNGRTPHARGWTTVRIVYDLSEEGSE